MRPATAPGRAGCLLLLALATGCAAQRAQTLDAMVGEDVDVAIEALGQPAEVIDLGEGRRQYVWQRIFTYDFGHPSFTLEEWRYESTFWFEDDVQEAPARLCATRLDVAFDFRIERWDYACERITVQRQPWPAAEDQGNPVRIPRDSRPR